MSKVSTGNKSENIAKIELEREGYTVWKAIRHRFCNIDLWGVIDLACYKPFEIRFIQVTTNATHGKREKLRMFRFPPNCTLELWVRMTKNKRAKKDGWYWKKEIIWPRDGFVQDIIKIGGTI